MSLTYPEICLHAVSRDGSSFPHPCLYMLTSSSSLEDDPGDEDEAEGEPELSSVEMRLVLENNEDCE